MSSTRRATDDRLHQNRFCSAPEFESDGIAGLAAAKRIALVQDENVRQILWFIQWRSLTPNGLQHLCTELLACFPDRLGTVTLRRLSKSGSPDRQLRHAEVEALNSEFGSASPGRLSLAEFCAAIGHDSEISWDDEPPPKANDKTEHRLSAFRTAAQDAATELGQSLIAFCIDPKANLAEGVWYFDDLLGALKILRDRFCQAARTRMADTLVSRSIKGALDFCAARRRMVLIEGVAGIGRTATLRAWCDSMGGLVRYVEVPSSNDDRSFYANMAQALGVARGLSFNQQQIKLRVEETLKASGLIVALDESQYLWPQYNRPRGIPSRMLWVKTAFDAGTPFALIAHSDFSKWQAMYVKQTMWTDEQFERRVNRKINLPREHSLEDMLKIARAHLPGGDQRSWKLLAGYALATPKKQASAIVEALESARYRASLAGRDTPTFEDLKGAVMVDHMGAPEDADAEALQPGCTPAAKATKGPLVALNGERSKSLFPMPVRLRSSRPAVPARS
jgi:hypothetical protein